jgi:cytochrome oxidase assembly protein ShyY1
MVTAIIGLISSIVTGGLGVWSMKQQQNTIDDQANYQLSLMQEQQELQRIKTEQIIQIAYFLIIAIGIIGIVIILVKKYAK